MSFAAALALTASGLTVATHTTPAEPASASPGLPESEAARIRPVDPDATPETVALFKNMYALSGKQWMYGHQMDMAIGYTGATAPQTRNSGVPATATAFVGTRDRHDDNSATKQTWGQHAAVQGIDIGYLELKGEFEQFGPMIDGATSRPAKYPASGRGPFYGHDGLNVDGYPWDDLVQWVVESYRHGSIVTVSWHETNPVTYGGYGANLYSPGTWPGHSMVPTDMNQTAASYVLPGGELHSRYEARMHAIVEFNEDVTAANGGTPVPMIFRPYHEHSGDWFWWGVDDMERKFQPTTYEQFVRLYKQLQAYLMANGVHNFLYAISPDRSRLGEPSVLYQDLKGAPDLKALLDKYIDGKTWSAAVKATAHADLQAQYDEAQTLTETSFHWDEPIALNYSGVPLGTAEFRDWVDSGKWKKLLMRKWEQGFPGSEFVDIYGIDNYWESGGANGHSYHPYNGQQAKILELFCSSFDYLAEKARADRKIVAMTEGNSQIQEIHDRFATSCGDEQKYPYLKYVSYALTWQGRQSGGTGDANPVTGAYRDQITMAGEFDFYTPDVTAPTTAVSLAPALVNGRSLPGGPTLTLTADDGDGKGVEAIWYSLDDAGWIQYTAPVVVSGAGRHVVRFRAVDNFGNMEDANTLSFRTVRASFASLMTQVADFSSNPHVATRLNDKLAAAKDADTGKARNRILDVFEAQLAGQVGKAFTTEEAAFLTALERMLR
jgi:hypothetical protein